MQFPVSFPLINDRVIIRFWHDKTIRSECIGEIPELPNDLVNYNVPSIHAKGGILKTRWVNIYGKLPLCERNKGWF